MSRGGLAERGSRAPALVRCVSAASQRPRRCSAEATDPSRSTLFGASLSPASYAASACRLSPTTNE